MIISEYASSHVKFMHGIKVLMAKNYIDNLSEEVKKGKNKKAQLGYYPQQAPVGYKNAGGLEEKRVIIPDPDKSSYVKRLFELYATGVYSVEELRKKLYNEGFNHNGRMYSKPKMLFFISKNLYIMVQYMTASTSL